MRLLVTIIIFIPFTLLSQTKFEGKFSTSINEFYGTYYIFQGKKFKTLSWGCMRKNRFGNGKFICRNDSLIFNFTKAKQVIKPSFIIKDSTFTKNDSIDLEVQVFNSKGEPADFAKIVIYNRDSGYFSSNNYIFTDYQGKATFKVKNCPNLNLGINYFSLETIYYRLDSNTNINIQFHLQDKRLTGQIFGKRRAILINQIDKTPLRNNHICKWSAKQNLVY